MPVAPVLWCTKYQTTSAQAELETTELPSKFNYLRFYIEGEIDKYIELATTRPELSAACQCIIVHSDDEKNKYLLGKKVQVPLFGFSVPAFEDEKVEKDRPSKKCPCGCEDFVPEQDSMDTWAASSVTSLLNLD
ncbi:MAG: class I tRNA ligase family protein [Lachnospiraceae bacterium]|nr:class I tRNA ligase family protein [Lachnospiraceae bacterium]